MKEERNYIGTYRKKPVQITAVQNDGGEGCLSAMKSVSFGLGDNGVVNSDKTIDIKTLEGTMKANVGDYIIKGVNGEFYPCKPDIFERTYDPID